MIRLTADLPGGRLDRKPGPARSTDSTVRPEQQLRTVGDRRAGERGDGEQRVRLALERAQEAAGHLLRHVRRHPLELGAVEQPRRRRRTTARSPPSARCRAAATRRGDEQPAADVDLEVGAQLLRQVLPELDGVAQQRQGRPELPRPVVPELQERLVLDLPVQAARVAARRLGVQVVALDERHAALLPSRGNTRPAQPVTPPPTTSTSGLRPARPG